MVSTLVSAEVEGLLARRSGWISIAPLPADRFDREYMTTELIIINKFKGCYDFIFAQPRDEWNLSSLK